MTPPNLDLESAAHEASRSQPTSNSAPSDPVGTFQCDEPVYHDTPIELVSTALPLIFFLFFLVGAIVLVYALAQRQAIPRQLAIGLAVTIGIILSLWGLAISLYYRGRIASRTLLGRPKKVGCPIRQEDRAVIIETVIEKPNQTRCEAKRIERIQMWAGGIFQGVSLPGVRSRSPSERKGTRQSVITSFLHNPDGSWPNQVQGPEQVATAPRNHRRQIVAAETRISVASSNGMTPKEGRLLGAAKHYSASHEPSSPERKAARIPHHKGASTAPKVHHDQQPLSGDLAQERDGLSDQHLPKTLGFGDASRANDILDPGEGPSKKTHQKVEKPADISQILDKPPKRQNIRQEHTRVMSVEIPLSQLPLPPQRTSSQAQMPRAHLKTRSSPAYVKRRKYREPHKPQRSLSTAIDCSSSSAYSGLSSRAQKPLALRPATALHERQNPRPRQDTSIGSSGGEALPSPQGSRSPPQSNTGPLEFLELRRSAYIPFGELLVGGIAGNELVHEEAGRKYQAYRVSEEDEEVPAEGTSYKPYRPSNEEERPAVDNGGYRVYNPDPGPGPIQRQQAYYTGEFVHEELSESWNEQSKGAALQVEHFKHVAHPVSAQVCTRTPYRGNEAPDSSSLAQPGLAHNGEHLFVPLKIQESNTS